MVGLKSRLSVGSIVWLFVTVFVALAFCSISSVRGAAQSGLPSLFPIFPGRTVDDEPASEYDDGQDLPPIGQLAVEWTAVCHARSSDSQHIEAESEAEYLRVYSEQSRTSMQITYSGQCTYLVAGIVGDVFDLENETGTGTISGGGQREVRSRSVERDLCFRGEQFQEVDSLSPARPRLYTRHVRMAVCDRQPYWYTQQPSPSRCLASTQGSIVRL